MPDYVMGIDQGTTGTFVGIMDSAGQIVGDAYAEHEQFYPQPGWVEQNPQELWDNACRLFAQALEAASLSAGDIAGLGIANQGESVVAWDSETGDAVSPILVWQDTRTQGEVDRMLADRELSQEITDRTGLRPDAYFSATKIRWVIDHAPEAAVLLRDGRLRCSTLDSWIIWKLTSGQAYATDVSTASRTLLLNAGTLQWDEALLEAFKVPEKLLPEIRETTGDFGEISHPAASLPGVPIVASLVDQPAAMVGQGCLQPGQVKATYGTGCFINMNTGVDLIHSQRGLLSLVAWQRDGVPTYGLDGGVFTAGATINWLRDKAELIAAPAEVDELCLPLTDSTSAVWVPGQIGLGAPYWDRTIRGAWLGIDLSIGRGQLVRAVLEGIAARVAQIVDSMQQDAGTPISSLRVDGGLTKSRALMQIQADLLGIPVEVLADEEATARGVCSLAARATGVWKSDAEITDRINIAQTYEPAIPSDQRQIRLDAFHRAVAAARAWSHDPS